MIGNESKSNNSYYQRVDRGTAVEFLKDLANYIKTYGYVTWEKKSPTKPFIRNIYIFVPMKIINMLLKKYGVTSSKMVYTLREWVDSPYIAHTIVGFYIKGRRRSYSMWVFNFNELMKYADNEEEK